MDGIRIAYAERVRVSVAARVRVRVRVKTRGSSENSCEPRTNEAALMTIFRLKANPYATTTMNITITPTAYMTLCHNHDYIQAEA